jgi:hypothetical protein
VQTFARNIKKMKKDLRPAHRKEIKELLTNIDKRPNIDLIQIFP